MEFRELNEFLINSIESERFMKDGDKPLENYSTGEARVRDRLSKEF